VIIEAPSLIYRAEELMRILIIGGCGYIGSKLFLFLKEQGHEVDTVDLEWFGNVVNPDNKMWDYKKLDEPGYYQLGDYDSVVLLAGHSSVPMCLDNCLPSFENNVVNFVRLLEKLERHNCKFLYASSSSIYGDTKNIAAPEGWSQYDPKTYYDLQKQEIDYYARLSSVEFYGLRFGTVNGWSPNLRADIMLNKMYKHAADEGSISVFNKDIYRPILGIQDLCRAVAAILEGGDHRGIYNLASFNASVDEISQSISQALGGVEIVDKGSAPAYNFSIDTSKFQQTYNFEFRESVDSIVKSLIGGWHEAHKTVRERKEYV